MDLIEIIIINKIEIEMVKMIIIINKIVTNMITKNIINIIKTKM